jgi:outer membrane protein
MRSVLHTDRRPGGREVLLALLVACLAAPVSAQEPLTLEEALSLARGENPNVQISAGEAEVADWEVRSAMGSLLPSASASSGFAWQGSGEQRFGSLTAGQLGFGDEPSYLFSSYSLGLNYTLSGSTLRAPSRARASRGAALARSDETRITVELEVTRAYLDLQRQGALVGLVARELERAEANLRLAEAQEAVGSATPLAVRQAEVQVGRAEVAVLQAEQAVRSARLTLLQRMGVELDREVEPVTEFPVEPVRESEEALVRMAMDRNPGLSALRSAEEVAAVDVSSARSAYYPTLSLQAGISGFTRRASESNFLLAQVERQEQQLLGQCQFQNELFRRLAEPLPTEDCDRYRLTDSQRQAALDQNRRFPFDFTRQPAQASLTLSLPLFQGLDRQYQLEQAQVQRTNAVHRLREQERAVRVEVSQLTAAAHTAYRTVELEERNRELAEAQLRLARAQFELGDSNFLELVEAEAIRAQADRDYLEAVYQLHEHRARLQALLGGNLAGM